MSVIVILIIFSVLVAAGFLVAFIWAVRSGQYDDTESPAVRMLFDDNIKQKKDAPESGKKEDGKESPENPGNENPGT